MPHNWLIFDVLLIWYLYIYVSLSLSFFPHDTAGNIATITSVQFIPSVRLFETLWTTALQATVK